MHREPDVYVLTYDHPHRKTQDLLYRLKLAGFGVGLLVLDWHERRNHQPLYGLCLPPAFGYGPEQLGRIMGFDYRRVGTIDDNFRWSTDRPVLVGGAPVLPPSFVANNRVFNVHPGWLPKVRGLDSLKWAIYYGCPIGVTVHRIDEQVDYGQLVAREEIPLFPTDSLQSIALRQYEQGLDLFVRALAAGQFDQPCDYAEPSGAPTRRMKHADELLMMERLNRRLTDLQVSQGNVYIDCAANFA